MTDKELLELAAKAADVFLTREKLKKELPEWEWDKEFEPYHLPNGAMRGSVIWYGSEGDVGGTEPLEWDPINDDGDALRLAVDLRMDVVHFVSSVRADVNGFEDCHEHNGDDHYAATRRAIVRAAAEIGKIC